ncbi:MAG: hypothetical protein QOK34_673 [Gaiellaceae bacterium]|nr:hypothetical protein [Gaiellaceae bacterium]MDX6435839.1 hypothetical protein [Gaiellaceae bacterium]
MSRPRPGTVALALLAVAVVGAASFDSIRKALQGNPPAQQPQAAVVHGVALGDRALLTAQLQIDGADGVLYFVDRDCQLRALRLPSLAAAPAPRDAGCSALVSPSSAPPGWSLWPRETPLAARCVDRRVIVSATAGPSLPMIGGCSPAWRLDGSMTYIRRGAIVQFPRVGRAQVLRSRNQLAAALERLPALRGSTGWRVSRVAWLGSTRFAVIASNHARTIAAVFAGRRIVAFRPRLPARGSDLRASPRGRYVVLRDAYGVDLFDARQADFPRVRRFDGAVSVAWSSDERWLAVASGSKITLAGPRNHRVVLPLLALDLAWTRDLG